MKRLLGSTATALLMLLLVAIPAFSQAGFFAAVTGTVSDSSGALIPGVTIKATAVNTGVITTTLTNESGSYNFANLLPGKYTISASLPGFQTKNLTDLELSQNTSYRFNFQLTVAGVNTQVEVSITGDTILSTSGATVGQVLAQQKVQDLPHVGNNVLDLITVMAGVENIVPSNPPSAANAFGRENTTFAGVSAQNVAIVRDGIQVQDNRYPNGIYSATTINPDLVGEIRLILAPVDAELGRGNGAIQYSTRSGTNKYSGSAVWSFRNTALDPNTWTNNRNQTVPAGSPPGTVPKAIQPDWANVHQGTVSYGGPIVRNKTFFFALYDFNIVNQRVSNNMIVLTPCARLGIFRYFNGWNNGNVFQTVTTTGANPIRPSVDINGTPLSPATNPNGTPLSDPSLQYISVFGPLQSKPTAANCSDAAINTSTLVPNGVNLTANPGSPGGGWDSNRRQIDTTGYIDRFLDFFPEPNNYEVGDGLNTAGYRLLRHFTGLDNLFGSGEATGRRKQINVKIDQNFASAHKANVNVTYERVDSDDVLQIFPTAFSNRNFRRPIVISSGLTSTLSASLLNEARFGMRRQGTNVIAPWDREVYQDDINAYLPPQVNGFRIIPQVSALGLCYPHSGVRPGVSGNVNCGANGAVTATSIDKTPTYTFADTLSWTRGAHAFKFGGELRLNSSEARTSTATFFSNFAVATLAIGGSVTGSAQGSSGPNDIANSNAAMTGLLGTNSTNARALANFLAGSLSNITNLYFTTNPNDLSKWSDYRDKHFLTTKLVQREFSSFVKDDYKISRNWTLNLGVRWDYYGVPYVDSGLTVAAVGGGDAVFGISGRDFSNWMKPGARADVTSVQFVGPHSPNPKQSVYPNDYNNFGPAIGFAWNVPYQVTFQGGGRFNTLQGPLASPPGSTLEASPNYQNVYVDMTTLNTALPIPPSVLPMQPVPTTARSQNFTTFDSHYVNPYVQNLTLSITRSVNKNLTLDVRYVGTLSRKNYTTININSNNFLYNGLLDALNRVRTGTEITKAPGDPLSLLDQMFAGINLCTSTLAPTAGNCTTGQPYGAIGQTVGGVYQTAAYQMRSNTTFQANLANGAFNNIAGTINTLNYANSGSNSTLPVLAGQGTAMRLNGFPDNFIATNPQFGNMNLLSNMGYSNYHSLQVQASLRPVEGFSGQATYTWSKNLGVPCAASGACTFTDPTNRSVDYTNINGNPGHSLRTNGTIELPIGPNKLLMGNTSGLLARAIERWQLGLIFNLGSGAPVSITANSMLYGNGVPDLMYPVDFKKLRGVRWNTQAGNFIEGRYLDNNDTFVKFDDPVCSTVTNLQGLAQIVGGVQQRCTLDALWMAVPPGTANATNLVFNDGVTRPAVVVLQHPQPGKKGNLGNNTLIGLGTFRFDANLGKTFQITESKSLQVRFDAQNVLNHPQPTNPSLTIATPAFGPVLPFGQIASKTGNRLFQGQLRLSF
jgi:hypothetical protein